MTIVLPLVKAAPKLCLGFGFAIGFGGGRASSSEEVERTISHCASEFKYVRSARRCRSSREVRSAVAET